MVFKRVGLKGGRVLIRKGPVAGILKLGKVIEEVLWGRVKFLSYKMEMITPKLVRIYSTKCFVKPLKGDLIDNQH